MYGDTRPGERDHYVVARISGSWTVGAVRGYGVVLDWGPAAGLAGFVPARDGQSIPVSVLISDKLEQNLRQVDEYEGPGFRREVIAVETEGAVIDAYIYVSVTDE